ncbi:3166_t:CDS:1, partial [Racocetra fulgida]
DSMVECFGITRDPETSCYMFVIRLCNENLYQFLKRTRGRLDWRNRIDMLYEIVNGLKQIHDYGFYHGNLHGGNLLTEMTTNGINIRISDTGLHGPPDRNSSTVYGVLPFIAPEVLKGDKYTQASDVYSFGIIMWVMSSCIPPFNQISHDHDLAALICDGLRPKINENIPDIYSTLMTRCWHQDPKQRPKVAELCNTLSQFASGMRDNTSSISQEFTVAYAHSRGASK